MLEDFYKYLAEKIDEEAFKFLNENGYKIEKPYTLEKALAIKEQLEKDGKELRYKVETEKNILNDDGSYEAINKIRFCFEEDKK